MRRRKWEIQGSAHRMCWCFNSRVNKKLLLPLKNCLSSNWTGYLKIKPKQTKKRNFSQYSSRFFAKGGFTPVLCPEPSPAQSHLPKPVAKLRIWDPQVLPAVSKNPVWLCLWNNQEKQESFLPTGTQGLLRVKYSKNLCSGGLVGLVFLGFFFLYFYWNFVQKFETFPYNTLRQDKMPW